MNCWTNRFWVQFSKSWLSWPDFLETNLFTILVCAFEPFITDRYHWVVAIIYSFFRSMIDFTRMFQGKKLMITNEFVAYASLSLLWLDGMLVNNRGLCRVKHVCVCISMLLIYTMCKISTFSVDAVKWHALLYNVHTRPNLKWSNAEKSILLNLHCCVYSQS